MNLNLREIEYVLAISQEGNITRAARRLYIAQPSLSQALKRIEEEIGTKLFLRTQNQVMLTPAGKIFVETGKAALEMFDEMKDRIDRSIGAAKETVRLGMPFFLGSFLFPQIIKKLQCAYPEINVELTEASSLELENKLVQGDIELALIPAPLSNKWLESVPFLKSRMILLVPVDDPINQHAYYKGDDGDYPYLDLRLADKRDFLVGRPGQRIRHINEIIFQKAKITPNIIFCSQSIETIRRISATGAGMSIIPEYYLQQLSAFGDINRYNLEPEYGYEWSMLAVYRNDEDISPPAKRVMQILIEQRESGNPFK